ncbi:hypothetical protein M8C21_027093, partial [Ambrosia artemisiifolia]
TRVIDLVRDFVHVANFPSKSETRENLPTDEDMRLNCRKLKELNAKKEKVQVKEEPQNEKSGVCWGLGYIIATLFLAVVEMSIDTIILSYCQDAEEHQGTAHYAPPPLIETFDEQN